MHVMIQPFQRNFTYSTFTAEHSALGAGQRGVGVGVPKQQSRTSTERYQHSTAVMYHSRRQRGLTELLLGGISRVLQQRGLTEQRWFAAKWEALDAALYVTDTHSAGRVLSSSQSSSLKI